MKYIKLYEQLSQTYFKVEYGEYDRSIDISLYRDKFTENESLFIEKSFKNLSICKSDIGGSYEIDDRDGTTIYIKKVKDQWFLIGFENYEDSLHLYYKCDQWDGFVDCIESEILPLL